MDNLNIHKKRIYIYVFVTLFLSVIVSIPMVLLKAGEADSIVGITSVVFMFLPLISTLITKRVTKDESKIPFKISIKDNLKYLAISAFLPGVCIVSGAVIYFVCFPNQLDLNIAHGAINAIREAPLFIAKSSANALLGPKPSGIIGMSIFIIISILVMKEFEKKGKKE